VARIETWNMSEVNQFSERYKSLSNSELMEILERKNDYQPLAVKSAQIELNNRQLTGEQFAWAKWEFESRQKEEISKGENASAIEDKIKTIGLSILSSLNPIQAQTPTTNKLINIICIVFSCLFIYKTGKNFDTIKFLLEESTDFDLSSFLYLLPIVLLPVSVILFWLKKRLGWFLLSVYLASTVVGAIFTIYFELKWNSNDTPGFHTLVPPMTPLVHVFTFLFYGGMLWVTCKENIREVYFISKRTMLITMVMVVGLTVSGMFILLS
jgi:hypothetical protein